MAFRTRYRRKAPSSPEVQGLFFKKAQVASAFFNPSHSVVQRQESATPAIPEEQPVQKQEMKEEQPVQKQEMKEEPVQAKVDGDRANSASEAQPEQTTSLPDSLKTGIKSLSGIAMDDVRVHYNSSKPAQMQALAYTQGSDIYVAPGQEKYLPHEAWHVVQQKQGRVMPTRQAKGAAVNDDPGLEQEATTMGHKASEQPSTSPQSSPPSL